MRRPPGGWLWHRGAMPPCTSDTPPLHAFLPFLNFTIPGFNSISPLKIFSSFLNFTHHPLHLPHANRPTLKRKRRGVLCLPSRRCKTAHHFEIGVDHAGRRWLLSFIDFALNFTLRVRRLGMDNRFQPPLQKADERAAKDAETFLKIAQKSYLDGNVGLQNLIERYHTDCRHYIYRWLLSSVFCFILLLVGITFEIPLLSVTMIAELVVCGTALSFFATTPEFS